MGKGDHVECVVWPHEGRAGEIVDAIQIDGETFYNIWLFDNNEILSFEDWEVKPAGT